MKVRKIRLVIENYKKKKEDGKYLEGIRKIGEEIFEAIELSYSDMDEIPTGYYEIMDLIDEAYDKGDFDEAVDMMYLLAYLCDDISRLKVEAFACMSESTKEIFYFMCLTGVRVGELGVLKWEDIDFKRKLINIRHFLSSQC